MRTYEIYDDILTLTESAKIYKTFVDESFPWYFSDANATVSQNATVVDGDEHTKEFMQFVHLFNINDGTPNSGYTDMTDFILSKFLNHVGLKLKKLLKVKANFQTQCLAFSDDNYNTPHIDSFGPHYVLLYYVNDSDGDTRVWNRKIGEEKNKYQPIVQVTPKAGRFLLFNGEHYHCGAHPSKSDKRILINFNFELDETI